MLFIFETLALKIFEDFTVKIQILILRVIRCSLW